MFDIATSAPYFRIFDEVNLAKILIDQSFLLDLLFLLTIQPLDFNSLHSISIGLANFHCPSERFSIKKILVIVRSNIFNEITIGELLLVYKTLVKCLTSIFIFFFTYFMTGFIRLQLSGFQAYSALAAESKIEIK